MKSLSTFALIIMVAASGCTMTINNRSQVHNLNQKAEYDGRISSNPEDSSEGNSVNAERTTEAAVSTSSGAANTSGNGGKPEEEQKQ